MLVLHYTGMLSADAALARMCDPAAEVSAHYMIDEDGTLYRLVDEDKRAWHAGVSVWRGQGEVNARSIGIELVNPGHEFGLRDFPAPQMAALVALCQDILGRHGIAAENVVGHADIAPGRKADPGERFNWAELAGHGIGFWPDEGDMVPVGETAVGATLDRIGYETKDLPAAITAFQRRFYPSRVDGVADEATRRCMAQVSALYPDPC